MATIEEGLLAYIEANIPSAGKGYPLDVPQDAAYPAFAYQVISETKIMAHDGPLKLRKTRIQITFIAATYAAAKSASNELAARLDGFKGWMLDRSVQYCETETSDDWADIHQLPVAKLDVKLNYQ